MERRRDNISAWALARFREHYGDAAITREDIFYYLYAALHHPAYREQYAVNLRRALPGAPFLRLGAEVGAAGDFHALAAWGRALADLHLYYEAQPEYPLVRRENPRVPPSLRVEKMALSPDKTALRVNEFLTLAGIPAAAYDYRLGNRSALEWMVEQCQVKTDARSGIVNDPNRPDDAGYIVRLVGQVIHVSLETPKRVGQIAQAAW